MFDIPKGMKFKTFYLLHKHDFSEEEQKLIEEKFELLEFHHDVYLPFMHETKPLLIQLVYEQFPCSRAVASQTAFSEFIAVQVKDISEKIIFNIGKLPRMQQQKVDLREKYDKLDRWNEFYCRPKEPKTLNDADRPPWVKDEEEWEHYRHLENRRFILYHQWEQKRLNEFYEIVQPRLFNHIPELHELEKDYWISYAVYLRDFYELWIERFERLETVIENEMPPELLYIGFSEFTIAYEPYFEKNSRRLEEERKKRIFGRDYDELK